jgi:DNA-binding HxlR family transcriptional regulator
VRPLGAGGESGRRAGTQVLSLFSAPLNGLVLRALADGPCRRGELHELVGWPAPSTLRDNLDCLTKIGAVGSSSCADRANAVDHALTPLGDELLVVADAIDTWLGHAPGGPLGLGNGAAKAAVGALAGGWDTAMVRALAAGPITLAELDGLIADVSYPTLWRRLAAMRVTGQVERRSVEGLAHAYGVTDWLREAVLPLALAARCEHRHLRAVAAPITWVEVESAFLLTLPLVALPEQFNGPCTLAVDTGEPLNGGSRSRVAGVRVEVREGRVVSCSTRLLDGPATWALGSAEGWLDAVADDAVANVSCGGAEPELAFALIESIRQALGSLDGRVLS